MFHTCLSKPTLIQYRHPASGKKKFTAVDSLVPALLGPHGPSSRRAGTNSFRRFPIASSVHLDHFAGVTGDAAVGEEIRRVGEDGVEAAFGIFGGDGVEQFQTVSMIKPDFFGRKNQAGSWVLAFWFLGTRNPGTWTRNPNNLAVFAEGEMGRSEEFGSWEFEVGSLGNGSRGSPQSGTGCSPHRFWLSTLVPRLSAGLGAGRR